VPSTRGAGDTGGTGRHTELKRVVFVVQQVVPRLNGKTGRDDEWRLTRFPTVIR
jgi:hypothetical protein